MMRSRKTLQTTSAAILLAFGTGAFAAAADAGESYRLRYKFKPKQQVHYEVTHSSTTSMSKDQTRSIAKDSAKSRKHFTVISVDEMGNAVLEPVIDAVKMSVQFDNGPKKTFDSESKENPLKEFANVKRTIGKPLVRLTVSPTGRLIKAKPLLDKDLQKKVAGANGEAKPAEDPSKNFLVVFPEKKLQVGDTWTDDKLTVKLTVQTSPRLRQDFTILRMFQLESVKDGKATIRFTMAPLKPIQNNPQLETQLIRRLIGGTIVFDLERGLIVSRKSSSDRKVHGAINGQGLLHVTTDRTEELIPAPKVASTTPAGKPE